jgi:hypothetical protein
MANLLDFKILNEKCRKYFGMLETELGRKVPVPSDKHVERFGFYLFVLESICSIKDVSDILPMICDQEFNSIVFDCKDEDWGVDAVFIDEDDHYINLFNFKFRMEFNDKQQNINETFLTTKFTNTIIAGNTTGITGKLEAYSKQIIKNLQSKEVWKLRLYVVSNDAKEIQVNTPEIRLLRELYDLEVVPKALDSLAKIMSIRPQPIDAVIHIDVDSILPFTESSLSSSKSYIIRISANDLIRITCNNKNFREDYKMEDYSNLYETEMEYNVLFDNVRGFITNSKFNPNLAKTLKDEPSKFFMYNNGLTLTANDIISEDTNAKQKIKITIRDFQVVNGGQTLRTLHSFKQEDKDNIHLYLSNCELLLRVFKTSTALVRNRIAEYTNSQNAISSIDLKSLSDEQIQIEQYLDEHNIVYVRKIGDTGHSRNYIHRISMEKFGQILFAVQGSPEKASNLKKHIFEKYYDTVFGESNFVLEKAPVYINRYFEIKQEYESLGYPDTSDQRIFFIMYIDPMFDASTAEKIALFETSLQKFRLPGKKLTDVRKLLQGTFRQRLEKDVAKYKKSKMDQKRKHLFSREDSISQKSIKDTSLDSPCAYLDYKGPKNKVEQFAVIARFRELKDDAASSMRDDFEVICNACGILFERNKFSDDMKHGKEAGLFSYSGSMADGFALSVFGQKYVDLLPDRDAIKALKNSNLNKSQKSNI